jgi:lipopolysaccharide transport system ATP-binding protein
MTSSALANPPETASDAATALPPVVIRADNLSKRFRIYERPLDRLWEWLGRKSRAGKSLHTDFWAVRNISFEVRRGECLGIIGPNGSGKSTLLKMIAGALHPTEGTFTLEGRVLSLIELGTGLNPLLSGRANITTAATLLGFPASFARDKIDEIEAFAELGEFFDRPVNLYSSGMKVRLAFSMFACFRPEIFIVDEALSVGDVFFQQKCAARIRELMASDMTMIFVSHDQSAVLSLCTRAIVLNHGQSIFQGAPDEASSRYLASLSSRKGVGKVEIPAPSHAPVFPPPDSSIAASILRHDITAERRAHRHGTGELIILAARVVDDTGHDTMHVQLGDTLTFQILLEAREPIDAPRAGLRLFDRFSNMVFAAGTSQLRHRLPPMNRGDRLVVSFSLTLDVQPDKYTFGLGAGEPVDGDPNAGIAHDRIDRLGPITVDISPSSVRPFYGAARLPLTATHYPCGPGSPTGNPV